MHQSIETRLRRLERARLPAERMQAAILFAKADEDVTPRVADRIATGAHRQDWPLLIVRGDWREEHPS